MTEHTKEPWAFKDVPGAGLEIYANVGARHFVEYRTTGEGPTMIFGMPDRAPIVQIAYERWVQFEPKQWHEMQVANAARIVACVNACAGIPTDQLAARAPDALREAAEKAIKLMRHLEEDLKEYKNSDTAIVFQHASDYADRLHHAADALAEAIE